MVVTYYIKFFRTAAEKHNGILISLLLLVAETIIVDFVFVLIIKTITVLFTPSF